MTLKDKLQVEIMDLPIMDEVIDDIGTNLEYVADNFAIGFLNWYFDKGQWITRNLDVKGLLEIYKKEKKL
jgi:hypothetical protein